MHRCIHFIILPSAFRTTPFAGLGNEDWYEFLIASRSPLLIECSLSERSLRSMTSRQCCDAARPLNHGDCIFAHPSSSSTNHQSAPIHPGTVYPQHAHIHHMPFLTLKILVTQEPLRQESTNSEVKQQPESPESSIHPRYGLHPNTDSTFDSRGLGCGVIYALRGSSPAPVAAPSATYQSIPVSKHHGHFSTLSELFAYRFIVLQWRTILTSGSWAAERELLHLTGSDWGSGVNLSCSGTSHML